MWENALLLNYLKSSVSLKYPTRKRYTSTSSKQYTAKCLNGHIWNESSAWKSSTSDFTLAIYAIYDNMVVHRPSSQKICQCWAEMWRRWLFLPIVTTNPNLIYNVKTSKISGTSVGYGCMYMLKRRNEIALKLSHYLSTTNVSICITHPDHTFLPNHRISHEPFKVFPNSI